MNEIESVIKRLNNALAVAKQIDEGTYETAVKSLGHSKTWDAQAKDLYTAAYLETAIEGVLQTLTDFVGDGKVEADAWGRAAFEADSADKF